jgi:hypothetical protein
MSKNGVLPGFVLKSISCLFLTGLAIGQAPPKSNLVYIQNIPVPNWTATGTNQANFDLFAFNPRTRVMYVADRTNKSVTAIDTIENNVIGVLPLPTGGSTNGVLVVPDLQVLVVTDGKANVLVWDLRTPGGNPDIYAIPQITGGTDALDYDPLNGTVYVINGSAPYFMTGIDLKNKKVRSQLSLPGSPELMKFNPVDGKIYQVITDGDNANKGAGLYVFDPATNTLGAKYLTPTCVPHGIDIDPVTNVALLGCGTNQGQIMMDLSSGKMIQQYMDVTGTDLLVFGSSTRKFYTGSSSNVSTTSGCSADSTKAIPVIGIFNSNGTGAGILSGVQCTGRNAHGLGFNSIDNFLYVGVRQYPVDPNDATTGQPGVLVYFDPSALQGNNGASTAMMTALSSKVSGTLQFTPQFRGMRAVLSIPTFTGSSAVINIPTIHGNEVVTCGIDSTKAMAYCEGPLIGNPLVGGTAILAVDGAPAATGVIKAPATM